jgi:D-sedoheptulose 7-phosphate isomerase
MTSAATVSVVQSHFAASVAASNRFFEAEAPRIALCCAQLADRFAAGGTLWVIGQGAQASDAHHVSVEFVHPILVGKRALPAVSLASHPVPPAARLRALTRPHDVLLLLSDGGITAEAAACVAAARDRGLLIVAVTTSVGTPRDAADFSFVVHSGHPLIVQEVTETLYHVLWELVHVFLDAIDAERPSFLGPSPAARDDLVAHVVESTRQKGRDIAALRDDVVARCETDILQAADALAARCRRSGRLLTCGNGGSATDAQDAVIDAVVPAIDGWRHIPALALTDDVGIITAIANDVGVEHVFARQMAAFGRAEDVALMFSTSGASRNILAALRAAKARGLLTIAMTGGDGGALAQSSDVDFCFTAPSDQLPRIQEAHATIWHALLIATQERLR